MTPTIPMSIKGRAANSKTGPMPVVLNGSGRRLLNAREAARYLGLAVDTVYRKARLRELPSVKVGRALRFDINALERVVEEHTIETID